jgi:hypothetical protein
VKIALNARRIHKKVSGSASYWNQSVRVGDEATARKALVSLCAISANCIQNRVLNDHF